MSGQSDELPDITIDASVNRWFVRRCRAAAFSGFWPSVLIIINCQILLRNKNAVVGWPACRSHSVRVPTEQSFNLARKRSPAWICKKDYRLFVCQPSPQYWFSPTSSLARPETCAGSTYRDGRMVNWVVSIGATVYVAFRSCRALVRLAPAVVAKERLLTKLSPNSNSACENGVIPPRSNVRNRCSSDLMLSNPN
jgi:hypothetical protein